MPRDQTKLHDLPDRFVTDRTASAGRGPPWLMNGWPAGQLSPGQPYHRS